MSTETQSNSIAPGGRVLTMEILEVLPPVIRAATPGAPMPLAEIEDHIRQISTRISEYTRGYHNKVIYDIVAKGLMLLKARAAHLHISGRPKKSGETVSPLSGKALAKAEEKAEQGFLAWFEKTYPDEQIRTARNHMNAARNAGLTADHTLADVDQLREARALHEKKPTDLYRIAPALKPPTDDDDGSTPRLVAAIQLDLFNYLDQAVSARDAMEADEFEATTTRIQATLEKLTGHRWVMSDEPAEDDSAQHGDQHAQPAPKKEAKRKK